MPYNKSITVIGGIKILLTTGQHKLDILIVTLPLL